MSSQVGDYFAGKTVMLTGGTGFIGKVLVEKLLRCCPDVDKIYLLIRPKAGQDPVDRIRKEFSDCKLFDKLRKTQPNYDKKLIPICSDMVKPNLGLSDEDAATLQEDVHIIFHSAATIRFDEKLKLSLELNVVGCQKLIELSRKMKRLEVFEHVSTAYAHCDKQHIEEIFYPPPADVDKLLDAVSWMTDDMINNITPQLLGKKPNTYTFTKAIAEHKILELGKGLPICVIRPSIVGAAWKDPFPGWIDNLNGPSGLFIACGKGFINTMIGDKDVVFDLNPVDFVVNMMITIAWHTAVTKPTSIPLYNCVTSPKNPFTVGQMASIQEIYHKIPLEKALRRPSAAFTTNQPLFEYRFAIGSRIPCYLMDLYLRFIGKRPRMVKISNQLTRVVHTLKYFTQNDWVWTNHNSVALQAALNEHDRKIYFMDVAEIHWPTYLEQWCIGTKQYILNEDMLAIPAAKRHLKMLRNFRWAFNTLLLILVWRLLIARSELARNLWHLVTNLFFKFVRFFGISSTQ